MNSCADSGSSLAAEDLSNARPGQLSNPPGYQDAVDEARIAAEQIVIPRQQPIELLPRTQRLLDAQVNIVCSMHGSGCDALCPQGLLLKQTLVTSCMHLMIVALWHTYCRPCVCVPLYVLETYA